MSVDPLAAGVADLAAALENEVAALAADAQALGSLLVEGAVVSARVLPSNGLTDLLDIAGRRVAASLPPTVRPGDVVAVRVTGFDGGRIVLQIVDAAATAPATAAPAITATATAPAPGAPPTLPATARPIVPPAATANGAPAAPVPPGPGGGIASGTAVRGGGAYAPGPVRPAAAVPGAAGATVALLPAAPGAAPLSSIETRLAAARAAVAAAAPGPAEPPPPSSHPAGSLAARFVAPPQIGSPAAAPARASVPAAFADPAALLRALRLPATPANVAAAALALDQPDRLPAALLALERALPAASADPRVATLRTLLPFVGHIEPGSPVLAAQIEAFVDQVVDGNEPKLVTLLAATRTATPPPAVPGAAAPPPPVLPAALAAERAAAVGADLKQTLLAVAADAATPEPLGPALAGALTALTGVQTSAAQLLAGRPDGLAFSLPLATPHGQQTARIAIQREAPRGGGAPLDGANFRIAFVLDTAHYGTVAIDLVTVGREVTVEVRAPSAPAVRAFRDALGGLTARLESLRYRVAAAGATVAPAASNAAEAPAATVPLSASQAPAAHGVSSRSGALDRSA